LSQGGAVWTGRRLIVVGQTCPGRHPQDSTGDSQIRCAGDVEAGEFDPATNEWRRLDPPPRRATEGLAFNIRTRGAGWTGRHAVFTFGDSSATVLIALFDPIAGTWQTLPGEVPPDPLLERGAPGPTVCVAGESVLRMTFRTRISPSFGWRLVTEHWDRHEERWVRLAPELDFEVPEGIPFGPRFACESETEALVVSWSPEDGGTVLHRFGGVAVGWQQLPSLPSASPGAALFRSGQDVAVWPETYADSRYYLLDPRTSEWRTVDKPGDGYRRDVSGPRVVIADREEVLVVDPIAYANADTSTRGADSRR
jgi:hypothetical protein